MTASFVDVIDAGVAVVVLVAVVIAASSPTVIAARFPTVVVVDRTPGTRYTGCPSTAHRVPDTPGVR